MQFTVDFLSLHPSPKTKQLFSKKMKKDKPKKKSNKDSYKKIF